MGATIVAALILVGIGELAGRYFDSAIPVAIGWALAVTCLVAFMRFAARNS